MLDTVANFLDKTVSDFSKQRMLMIAMIIIFIIVGLMSYELLTARFQLDKYEDSIALLKSIEKLDNDSPESKRIVSNVYKGIEEITDSETALFLSDFSISKRMQQALWQILPWVIILLIGLPMAFKKGGSISAFFVVLCMAALMGLVGYMLPVHWNPWIVSLVISQSLNVVVLFFFLKLDRHLSKKQKAQ